METRRLIIILFLILIVTSCRTKDKQFDKETWNDKEGFLYENRKSMLNDLMKNYLHKGITYSKLVHLLGQPENYTNEKSYKITYEIEVNYGSDIDPVNGTNLVIELSKDSIVVNFELVKWKH